MYLAHIPLYIYIMSSRLIVGKYKEVIYDFLNYLNI